MVVEFDDGGYAIEAFTKINDHLHLETEETYKVIEGQMVLIVAGSGLLMETGDSFIVPSGFVHSAIGTGPQGYALIRVDGWSQEDRLLV